MHEEVVFHMRWQLILTMRYTYSDDHKKFQIHKISILVMKIHHDSDVSAYSDDHKISRAAETSELLDLDRNYSYS